MKVTDEQIEAAAKAMQLVDVELEDRSNYGWEDLDPINKDTYRDYARAAAPFLQMAWDEPTESEVSAAFTRQFMPLDAYTSMRSGISKFVANRNAALQPKPVDPRREAVIQVLRAEHPGAMSNGAFADVILKALDELEVKK